MMGLMAVQENEHYESLSWRKKGGKEKEHDGNLCCGILPSEPP